MLDLYLLLFVGPIGAFTWEDVQEPFFYGDVSSLVQFETVFWRPLRLVWPIAGILAL